MQNQSDRSASFVTIIQLIFSGNSYIFKGELKGTIATKPMGEEGFGYDPIFIPLNSNRTLAEMTLDEKNSLSHRSIAFKSMLQFLKEKLN